jgi:hypothetical protein
MTINEWKTAIKNELVVKIETKEILGTIDEDGFVADLTIIMMNDDKIHWTYRSDANGVYVNQLEINGIIYMMPEIGIDSPFQVIKDVYYQHLTMTQW